MQFAGNPSIVNLSWIRQLTRVATRLSYAALLVYHAVLLLLHVWQGRLLEPDTLLRWLLGGLLFAGFVWLRRLDLPLFWGRKAIALWALVALLHAHAVAVPGDGTVADARETAAVVLFLTQTVSLGGFAVGLLLLAWMLRQQPAVARTLRAPLVQALRGPHVSSGYANVISARPPPRS
ncbi:MAG: hypothetical protein AB7I50_16820 [Vicinamibacterales bacterium]